MDASDIKHALRRRHPGDTHGSMPGQWTCIEEWLGIDLLALNAWRKADVIGYEVKVSRSDMRRELLRPWKRADGIARTTEFYFAVPSGLLKPEEITFEEPEWEDGDFTRRPCPGVPEIRSNGTRNGGSCRKFSPRWGPTDVPRGHLVNLPVPCVLKTHGVRDELSNSLYVMDMLVHEQGYRWSICPSCSGTGHNGLSRVEIEAPTLWVPRDVGLIVVDGRGCSVVKKSPKRKDPLPIASGQRNINDLVRWVSHRPDPRHVSRLQGESVA